MNFKKLLCKLYALKRTKISHLILKMVTELESGQYYSKTLREIFKEYYKIEIGLYTYGGCFKHDPVDPYTTIGRYCSFASNILILNRNHPLKNKSTHAFFLIHV